MVGSIIDKTDAKSIFEPFQKKIHLVWWAPYGGVHRTGYGGSPYKIFKGTWMWLMLTSYIWKRLQLLLSDTYSWFTGEMKQLEYKLYIYLPVRK